MGWGKEKERNYIQSLTSSINADLIAVGSVSSDKVAPFFSALLRKPEKVKSASTAYMFVIECENTFHLVLMNFLAFVINSS